MKMIKVENMLPDKNDMEGYSNGAMYVRTHFVSKKIEDNEFTALEEKAKKAGAINCHSHGGIFNAMFRTQTQAKTFAKSL